MKTVRRIFLDDLKSLCKNFFALVIVVGICFLPALYAWFNIYSNWDPYGNTGALKLAAISLDEGYTNADGEYTNVGEGIIDTLHENTSVDWQFVDSEDEAINGVYDGTYYAAVVISEDFTYSMYNVFSEDASEPTLYFYENQKKNPVATKISDTVVSTLQTNINEAFVEVIVSELFSGARDVYESYNDEGGLDITIDKLKEINEDLTAYESTINKVIAADEALRSSIEGAKTDSNNLKQYTADGATSIDNSNKELAATQVTLNSFSSNLNTCLNTISSNIDDMQDILDDGTLTQDAAAMTSNLNACNEDLIVIENNLEACLTTLDSLGQDTTAVKAMIETTTAVQTTFNNYVTPETVASSMTSNEEQISEIVDIAQDGVKDLQSQMNGTLIPQMNSTIDNLETVLSNTSDTLNTLSTTFGKLTTMFTSLQTTLDSADVSLEKTNEALSYINNRLATAIEKVEAAQDDEKVEILINTLTGDPEAYGAFFSEPVEIETETVYPIANYGSAVAPFYTTLAIWVGALILTAIIKVRPSKHKYPNATPNEMYFGRYALYWILAQIQAVIIVVGDIELIGIQCIHPGWFMFACSCAATTFSLLIFSLVVTWGDVGKALSVVIVVLQIAGSSGTYPIELLPEFFQKVYIFFPFPYAINAMRECICGMYEMDYVIYLLELSIFIIASLIIGLLVRIPFEEINHYMEERMEDTEMM